MYFLFLGTVIHVPYYSNTKHFEYKVRYIQYKGQILNKNNFYLMIFIKNI